MTVVTPHFSPLPGIEFEEHWWAGKVSHRLPLLCLLSPLGDLESAVGQGSPTPAHTLMVASDTLLKWDQNSQPPKKSLQSEAKQEQIGNPKGQLTERSLFGTSSNSQRFSWLPFAGSQAILGSL